MQWRIELRGTLLQDNRLGSKTTGQNQASVKCVLLSRKNSQWDSAWECLQNVFLSGIVALLSLGSFKTPLKGALNLTDPEFLGWHQEQKVSSG